MKNQEIIEKIRHYKTPKKNTCVVFQRVASIPMAKIGDFDRILPV